MRSIPVFLYLKFGFRKLDLKFVKIRVGGTSIFIGKILALNCNLKVDHHGVIEQSFKTIRMFTILFREDGT